MTETYSDMTSTASPRALLCYAPRHRLMRTKTSGSPVAQDGNAKRNVVPKRRSKQHTTQARTTLVRMSLLVAVLEAGAYVLNKDTASVRTPMHIGMCKPQSGTRLDDDQCGSPVLLCACKLHVCLQPLQLSGCTVYRLTLPP